MKLKIDVFLVSIQLYRIFNIALTYFRCEISGFCLLSFPQNERTQLCSVCIELLNNKFYGGFAFIFFACLHFVPQMQSGQKVKSTNVQLKFLPFQICYQIMLQYFICQKTKLFILLKNNLNLLVSVCFGVSSNRKIMAIFSFWA